MGMGSYGRYGAGDMVGRPTGVQNLAAGVKKASAAALASARAYEQGKQNQLVTQDGSAEAAPAGMAGMFIVGAKPTPLGWAVIGLITLAGGYLVYKTRKGRR